MHPIWIVTGFGALWLALQVTSVLAPSGGQGWDRLAQFLGWQMAAAAAGLAGTIATVVLWARGRIDWRLGLLGLVPAAITGGVALWIVVFES